MAVHQLIPSFVSGDAMGQAAINFRWLLRRLGHTGEIYAGELEHGLSSLAKPASELKPAPSDLVLYHHGIASHLAGWLPHLPCRRGVVFHNITPARFYEGTVLAEALTAGRAQLAAMAKHVELAVGVSPYNAAELEEAGYTNPVVVPLVVEPQRFGADRADPALVKRLKSDALTVVSVGRVVPHKRIEDLLALHTELRELDPAARLLLVGPYQAGARYFRELRFTEGVELLGRVSHAELVAAYRSATAYVSMSEHEGFGAPLIEAMAADVPVLAYGAAAVLQTLGGHGIAFDEKRFAFLAELVRELANPKLRAKVLAGQGVRLNELSVSATQEGLAAAIAPLFPPQRRPPSRKRPRVGVIVQRYGEVTGGAEAHARALAERLSPHWDITVLTSCAKDHLTWANELPAGESTDGPVRVLRFPSERARQMRAFNRLSRSVFGRPNDRLHEEHWVAEQGPCMPGLLRHLETERGVYDGFVAFTYLYAPTALGLPLIADRALLVPTAHDEPPFAFDVYQDAFERPRAILCNTPEEEALVHRRFPGCARTRVVGVGVDAPAGKPGRFRERHGVEHPYLLYVGRVEAGKGVPELLRFYSGYRRANPDAPDLLLAGTPSMRAQGPGVRLLGRISEEDKHDALKGADAAVVPSRYESLSLLALEAFAQGTPVVASGGSDVLRGQVDRSGAGATYLDQRSFVDAVETARRRRVEWSKNGRAYARQHRWSNVVSAYREELGRIMEER